MNIPQEMLQAARDNPTEGAAEICRFALEETNHDLFNSEWSDHDHTLLMAAVAVVLTLEEQNLIEHQQNTPDVDDVAQTVCPRFRQFLGAVHRDLSATISKNKFDSFRKHFAVTLVENFGYEFTDGDLKRIQQLINELREMVSANIELDDGHKRRMLKRLEKMQSELHKKMSDISRFYELMGDAGVALGRLGEGAKPFVDRIKEIVDIGWKSQARAEQLQSDAENPMIGQESEPKLLD
jgi:hypothetical protein